MIQIIIFACLFMMGLLGEVQAQAPTGYYVRTDCVTSPSPAPVTNGAICLQTSTTGGRTAGKLYRWDGSAWVRATDRDLENFTVATKPTSVANGDIILITDGLTATSCETGLGTFHVVCVYNSTSTHWESIASSSSSSDWVGRTISDAVDTSTCVKIYNPDNGQGACIYVDSSGNLVYDTLLPGNNVMGIDANKNLIIFDKEGNAAMWTIDPDAANANAMYQIASGYRMRKSVFFPAGALSTDGTQCAAPAEVTINSGAKRWTIICAGNDSSTIYGEVQMPDSWDGGTVTMMGEFVQTAADTSAMNSDIAFACRANGDTINNTWGTEVAMDIANMGGSNKINTVTTAAATPNGTCTGGSTLLQFRWQLDATGTTTAVATLHVLGFKLEYTTSSLSD